MKNRLLGRGLYDGVYVKAWSHTPQGSYRS